VATSAVEYHDATKHYFHRYARSLGYLDWATQPDPFRRFDGAAVIELPRDTPHPEVPYADLYGGAPSLAVDQRSIGTFLRLSLGLSAWKQYGASRWALRVNPSSGNLHPTEGYIVWRGRVAHYAPAAHAIEERCVLPADAPALPPNRFLVGLTSIIWREAWKYGERAFRYCQHDIGHAIGAVRFSAAMHGWRVELQPQWADEEIGALLGLDRDADFAGAEREEPECLLLVTSGAGEPIETSGLDPRAAAAAARRGMWSGRANTLSASHAEWPIIDDVVEATRCAGATARPPTLAPSHPRTVVPSSNPTAASIILQRRSALGYDPRGHLRRDAFIGMLDRLLPGAPPWDALGWPPQIHLALFVHRVQDVTPGIYAFLRSAEALPELKEAMRPEFLWEPVVADAPSHLRTLFLLAPIDVRATANRLSCNQDIAEDGFFSLGMIARFDEPLRVRGAAFYRRLFWECGLVGQLLYLEAEAAGARGTGIGCFFDDPVHELLGLHGHAWQTLYHFSMGLPVDDGRLTTEPGYPWECA
jgi:nitroreductase